MPLLPLFSVVQKDEELLNNYPKSWWSSTRGSTIWRRIFVLFVISAISVNKPLLARQSLHQKPLSSFRIPWLIFLFTY